MACKSSMRISIESVYCENILELGIFNLDESSETLMYASAFNSRAIDPLF